MPTRRLFLVSAIGLSTGGLTLGGAEEPKPKPDDIKVDNEAVQKLFDSMRNGTFRSGVTFPAVRRDDIPALLEMAKSKKELKAFPHNPFTSFGQSECPEGMVALWFIEGYRKGNKFPSLNVLCLPREKGGKDWEALSRGAHDKVREAYEAWWKVVKSMKNEELMKVDPLKDAPFYWY